MIFYIFSGYVPDLLGFLRVLRVICVVAGQIQRITWICLRCFAIFIDFRGCLHRPSTKKAIAGHSASGWVVVSQAIGRTNMGSILRVLRELRASPDFPGFLQISHDFSGFLWISLDFFGFLLISPDAQGAPGAPDFSGFLWISQKFLRFPWIFIGFFLDL